MKSNEELQKDVQYAIKWERQLHAAEIGVTVHDGVVTLTGVVDSYSKKLEAEDAAKGVAGVKALVEKIIVQLSHPTTTPDGDIASAILNNFKWNWEIPKDKIMVKVEDGWVTLDGEVNYNYQKEAAKRSIRTLTGVKGVTNIIKLKQDTSDEVEEKSIERALELNWSINASDIKVKAHGNTVTLSGTVSSWYQKEEAGRIAWNAPGVWIVNNELIVEYDFSLVD